MLPLACVCYVVNNMRIHNFLSIYWQMAIKIQAFTLFEAKSLLHHHIVSPKQLIEEAKEPDIILSTSEMIHRCRASLSKQQTAALLICHGTQQDLSLSTVT